LIEVFQGEARTVNFEDPAGIIATGAFAYVRNEHGTICSLPPEPAAYRDTPLGGDVPPQSTLVVRVQTTSGTRVWDERADLVHSDDSDEHYCLETDEHGHSVIRFGDGANGMTLPDLARVLVSYQTALGADGNIGADRLKRIGT